MATTTNYGWTTPDDTGLVKDGASAIRTLGSSIDTTTKNLNPETTLGDLAYRSSTANVKTRLGLGTAGQVLQVNSGATAPEWATISAGGMTLLASGSFANDASVVLSSISGSYTDLSLRVYNFRPATDGEQLYVRFNGDTGNNYIVSLRTDGDSTSIAFANRYQFYGDTDNGASTVGAGELRVTNYSSTSVIKGIQSDASGTNQSTAPNQRIQIAAGLYNSTTAITSLTMVTGSGNITSGSYQLFGVK
jgi:hypothetical protein